MEQKSSIEPLLRIWGGDWDLPSVDPDCLSIIAYAKFKGAPLKLEPTSPAKTVTGILPELQIEESVFTSPLNILGILRREGYNADFNLNSIDHADTLAYIAMVEEKLKPGLLQNLWIDSGNYVSVIRKAYAKTYGFLRSYWDLPQLRNKIEIDLACRKPGSTAEREVFYNREAKSCITLLSQKLGHKDYFFGSTPTTFDAVVYGCLSVLLKAPLVTTELKNHLLACDNLCKFCSRISLCYFKEDCGNSAKDSNQTKGGKEKISEAKLKEHRNQMIAFGVAIFVNLVYLVGKGIVVPNAAKQEKELIEADDILD